jgi:DMSO reductase family type II enzyme heme b subunit
MGNITSDTSTPGTLPKGGLAPAALIFLMANIAAVAYVFWLGSASNATTIFPAVLQIEKESEAKKPSSVVNDSASQEDSVEEDDEEYYDDWVDEPIRVVNEVELPSLEVIQDLFRRNCASCHGIEGRGDGQAAQFLIPRPRDFVGSGLRYAAEWAEEDHIIGDLERTLREGVPRSAMPAFGAVLSELEIAGLAKYVYDLRDRDQIVASDAIVDVGVRPPLTVELVDRGKELFATLACTVCHGESGAGDGENAMSLVDFQGNPVRPADFTTGLFKSGQRSEDLVRTILRGIPGTPMIAYEGILLVENDTEEETYNTIDAWALVAYIRTLAPRVPPVGISSGANIIAQPALAEEMLLNPIHPGWLGVEPVSLRVNPLQVRHDELSHVEVRAVVSGNQVAICMEWGDSTFNLLEGSGDLYPDGLAVMFGLDDSPSAVQVSTVATESDDFIINEWRWSADRQYGCVGGDVSAFQVNQDLLIKAPFLLLRSPADDVAYRDQWNWDDAERCNVVESNGMTPQQKGSQSATASAAWINGVWRLVITRELQTEDTSDVQFEVNKRIPISIAVWNGAQGEEISAMSVSSWHWLEIVMP